MEAMQNRLPTGPGSRGGKWHDVEYRRKYHKAWRAANPDYRDRERLRRARDKARKRGEDPYEITEAPHFPRPLPLSAVHCVCECECKEYIVVVCGFCQQGMHSDTVDEIASQDTK
jgi:hypothetical protein